MIRKGPRQLDRQLVALRHVGLRPLLSPRQLDQPSLRYAKPDASSTGTVCLSAIGFRNVLRIWAEPRIAQTIADKKSRSDTPRTG